MDREKIHSILRDDLKRAKAQSKLSTDAFHALLSDIPSGLPHPDGIQRIRNASIAHAADRTRLLAAAARLDAFLLDGTVPDDLKG